ncbi:hypothetical protein MMC11_002507 [Xylographa trunciseda]|nr:hypothetical protein [Xylographa trunciseda]
MTPVIEAKSLTSITLLAANPPQYPRNPTQEIQKPLVLYIARVPGSRDVFLTTLKPQQRVVTAHDVASSLYYFHVDSIHDEEIRDLLGVKRGSQRDSEKDTENARPASDGQSPKRKPLSSTAHLAPRDRSDAPPEVYPHFRIPSSLGERPVLERKPVGGNVEGGGSIADGISKVMPRKLWGPRPLHSRNLSVDAAMPSTILNEEILIPRRLSEQPPVVSPNLDVDSEPDNVDSQPTLFSITMIRRDPGSGGQWNVGKITSGPTARKKSDNMQSPRNPQSGREQSLIIEITNSGYNKYTATETAVSRPEKASLDHIPPLPDTQIHSLAASDSNKYHSFCRHLYLERPRSHSHRPSPHRSEFQLSAKDITPTSPYVSPWLSPSYPRPYTFLSPWNGTCEFSTGLAGRSLKCRHTLQSPASSPGSKDSSSARTVSDLRFNLPISKLLGSLSPRRLPLSGPNYQRSSFFGHSHNRESSDASNSNEAEDSDNEDDERMDLSLGQEQAGGGMRGKQAKLGKLIIEDEGLKMLDLVVAANMGVWWSVYGRGLD